MNYIIDLKLPSLNEYINACRSNRYGAAKMKREVEDTIIWFIKAMPRYETPIKIHFTWIEGNKKRDLDNICFAKKFILDAMQKAGKIPNDNHNFIKGFTDDFIYAHKTYVVVDIEEVAECTE
jgi:Holliday junction resolvase RusA-like endonuclease